MQDDPNPEVKTVSLQEILTPAQMEHACNLMNQYPDDGELAAALKAYLEQFKDELLAKGLVVDYLAYMLVAAKYKAMNNTVDFRGEFGKN